MNMTMHTPTCERALRHTFEVEAYRLGQQVDNLTQEAERAREILGAIPHGPTTHTLCQLAHNAIGCAQGRRRRIERMGVDLQHAHDRIREGESGEELWKMRVAALERRLAEQRAELARLNKALADARKETAEVLWGSYLPGCAIPEVVGDPEKAWYQGASRGYDAALILHGIDDAQPMRDRAYIVAVESAEVEP